MNGLFIAGVALMMLSPLGEEWELRVRASYDVLAFVVGSALVGVATWTDGTTTLRGKIVVSATVGACILLGWLGYWIKERNKHAQSEVREGQDDGLPSEEAGGSAE